MIRISDDPRRFDRGATLLHEDGRSLVVLSARAHRDRFLVRFEGSDSREDAEGLRGAVYVPAAEVRSLQDSEYWEGDVVGCAVHLADGSEVGRVTDVIVRPAQDLLEVETATGRHLIPFVDAIVTEVDTSSKRVVIDPPAGLLD